MKEIIWIDAEHVEILRAALLDLAEGEDGAVHDADCLYLDANDPASQDWKNCAPSCSALKAHKALEAFDVARSSAPK